MNYIVLVAFLAAFFGVFIGIMIAVLLGRRHKYVGNIVVIKDPDTEKTIYSLELDDDPEIIESKREVTFKVLIPDVESDRE